MFIFQNMINSIMAGFMIALSAAIYLTVGAPLGAFMFALGLLTILHFQFHLFTGKAGGLLLKQITPAALIDVWLGNAMGCALFAELILLTPQGGKISEAAAAITAVRISNLWFENILLGIFCGLLMYIAVVSYATKPYVTILAVASFILLGTNHCVADMAYMFLAANVEMFVPAFAALLCSTIGNVIGCNIIPSTLAQKEMD